MAKGELTFYFETLADLQAQLRAVLGLGAPDDKLAAEYAVRMERAEAPRDTLGCVGAGMSAPVEPTKAQVEEAGKITAETAQAIRTASVIDAEVRKANQEAAAAAVAAATQAAEPIREALKEMVDATPEKPLAEGAAQDGAPLTAETASTVPYEELLAFCDRTPAIGINTEKCKAKFFRPMVEFKVLAYLETLK